MDALYYLIPMSLLILIGAVAIFFWSLKRGQYEDMESPAHRILIDDREQQAQLDRRLAERAAQQQATDPAAQQSAAPASAKPSMAADEPPQ